MITETLEMKAERLRAELAKIEGKIKKPTTTARKKQRSTQKDRVTKKLPKSIKGKVTVSQRSAAEYEQLTRAQRKMVHAFLSTYVGPEQPSLAVAIKGVKRANAAQIVDRLSFRAMRAIAIEHESL